MTKIKNQSSTSLSKNISETSVAQHQKNLRELRCVICRFPNPTLHHTHGGSMKEYRWHVGVAQKQNPWLQIPLDVRYHTGNFGIDSHIGVVTWESTFGTQIEHLRWVDDQLGYDIWAKAKHWAINHGIDFGIRPPPMTESDSIPPESAGDTKN